MNSTCNLFDLFFTNFNVFWNSTTLVLNPSRSAFRMKMFLVNNFPFSNADSSCICVLAVSVSRWCTTASCASSRGRSSSVSIVLTTTDSSYIRQSLLIWLSLTAVAVLWISHRSIAPTASAATKVGPIVENETFHQAIIAADKRMEYDETHTLSSWI